MSRIDADQAHAFAEGYRFDLHRDFHALDSSQVEGVIAAANAAKYRAPRNANGSRARYFHAYLQRAVARADKES